MTTVLRDVIERARRRNFVGRREELRAFGEALAGRSPRRVLFVHGPGGIGKTTLLLEMSARARAAGRDPVLLDGREIDPSAEGFLQAVGQSGTLLVDSYEHLGAIDGWLRREFLPGLPENGLVVLAGREPRRRPGGSTRAGGNWSPSIASTTSTRPTARICCPGPVSPSRCSSGCSGWAAATR